MQALRLQISLGGSPVDIQLSPSLSAEDAIKAIVDLYELKTNYEYCLFHTNTSAWLDPGQTLASAGIRDGDFLEFKYARETGMMNIGVWSSMKITNYSSVAKSMKALRIDFTDPLRRVIPTVSRVLGLKGKEEYCFRKIRVKDDKVEILEFLNSNLSAEEQGLDKSGAFVALVPVDNFFERTLASIEKPLKEGWMSKKSKKGDSKSTSPKKRWFVLDEHFLYYFADRKPTLKPSGVIDLEFMIMEEAQQQSGDSSAPTLSITLRKSAVSFKNLPVTYIFCGEDAKDMKEWAKQVRYKTVNGITNRFFGVSLLNLFMRTGGIPNVLTKAIEYLERRGLVSEGIFRVPRSMTMVESLKDEIDLGREIDFTGVSDPNVVAGVLKLFLRELPEPLLTFGLYDEFIAAADDFNRLKTLVSALPVVNQVVIEMLVFFLANVMDHQSKNKMDINAIVIVFGPNFLRQRQEGEEAYVHTYKIQQIIKTLILQRAQFNFTRTLRHARQLSFRNKKQEGSSSQIKRPVSIAMQPLTAPALSTPPILTQSQAATSVATANTPPAVYARALYDYTARGQRNAYGEIDLSFKKGDLLLVIQERPNGWMKGAMNGVEGLIPGNYVVKVDPNEPQQDQVAPTSPRPISHQQSSQEVEASEASKMDDRKMELERRKKDLEDRKKQLEEQKLAEAQNSQGKMTYEELFQKYEEEKQGEFNWKPE